MPSPFIKGRISDIHGRPLQHTLLLNAPDISIGDSTDRVLTFRPDGTVRYVSQSSLVSGGQGITGGLNVGLGDGEIFKDAVGTDLRFRTLLSSSSVAITTNDNDISFSVTASAVDHGSLAGLADDDHPQYILTSVMTANADLITRAAGVPSRIPIGSNGQFLVVAAGVPTWASASGLIDHGTLTGLADDDHPQYGALAQNETVTGSWTLSNSKTIIGAGPGIGSGLIISLDVTPDNDGTVRLGQSAWEWAEVWTTSLLSDSIISTARLYVTSGADALQLRVQGAAVQTSSIFRVETNAVSTVFAVSNTVVSSFRQLFIDGGSNEIQLLVQGAAGQTANLATFENSAGTDLLTISSAGVLSINTAQVTGQINVLVVGSTTPGMTFRVGATATENLYRSSGSTPTGLWYGHQLIQDESVTGNLMQQVVNNGVIATVVHYERGNERVSIGPSLVSSLGGQRLGVSGLLHVTKGASFNTGGGSTDPDNFFKVFGNSGDAANALLYVNPTTTAYGLGINTTSTAGGIFNYAGGAISLDRAGAAGAGYAGQNIVCNAVQVFLLTWSGGQNYSSTAASIYGFGWQQDELTTGNHLMFRKDGEVGTGLTLMYFERASGQVGIGSTFTFTGTQPNAQLHVAGTFEVDSTSVFDGDISLSTGVDLILATSGAGTMVGTGSTQLLGFWGATPVVRPSAFTQTYSTATKTHANFTSADLVDATSGTADGTLQDVSGTGDDATVNSNFADIVSEFNLLRADLANVKQVLNAVIDDDQTIGIKA